MIKDRFWELVTEARRSAIMITAEKSAKYPDINPSDYFTCIGDPVKAAFIVVQEKYLRLKSGVNAKQRSIPDLKEQIFDLQNFCSFLYAELFEEEK